METKLKKCKHEDCENQFKPYLSTDKYCSYSCTRKVYESRLKRTKPKNIKPIKQVSTRQALLNRKYAKIRKALFLGGIITCAVYPNLRATEIHHKRKRRGYADQWARDNDIPLIIDTRYFLLVSRAGHQFIEDNPKKAYEMGWSEKNN